MIRRMTKGDFIQQLSEHLFWDVDRAGMDPDQHRIFIISRTMDRGTRDDVRVVWAYYGEEKVRDALLNAACLHKKTIAFFASQFDLPQENFRSFRNRTGAWDQ